MKSQKVKNKGCFARPKTTKNHMESPMKIPLFSPYKNIKKLDPFLKILRLWVGFAKSCIIFSLFSPRPAQIYSKNVKKPYQYGCKKPMAIAQKKYTTKNH